MNYLWEVLVKSKEQKLTEKDIRFIVANCYSPYMEVANTYINQNYLDEKTVVEINPFYRFHSIFKEFYHPDMTDFPELRESLTNLIFHMLGQSDCLSGMTKEEYHKKLLRHDFMQEFFGEQALEAFSLFNREEQEVLLSGLLRQYEAGSSLDLFTDIIRSLFPDVIVYHSQVKCSEILVYIGQNSKAVIEKKMDFIIKMFVAIGYTVEVYYENHFGILGIDGTMTIDEIGLF